MSSKDVRSRLEAARARHRERSQLVRVLAVAAGGLAGAVGLLLVPLLPELGLPLLLVGLRVLALEYEWAARAYAPVARFWERVKGLSRAWKIVIAAIAVLVVGGIVWWLAY